MTGIERLFQGIIKALLVILSFALILGCASQAPAQTAQRSNLYTYVNPDNYFEEVVKASIWKPVLVLFETDYYAAQGNYKSQATVDNLREVYKMLATEFNGSIRFARFDVPNKESSLFVIRNYNLKGLPSIVLYTDGRVVDIRLGGTSLKEDISPIFRNMKKWWLESLVIHPEKFKCPWKYNNQKELQKSC